MCVYIKMYIYIYIDSKKLKKEKDEKVKEYSMITLSAGFGNRTAF